jgi:hypothetical protein
MWVRLSDAELVAQSDIIVVATLGEIRPTSGDGSSRNVGVLDIRQVLKGTAGLDEARLALPSADQPLSSTDIHYKTGQAGLWFLRQLPAAGGGTVYSADHPQRFVPEEEASARMPALRKLIGTSQK